MKLEMRSENAVREDHVETIPSKASLQEMVDYVYTRFSFNLDCHKSSEEKKNFLIV
ncbi:MAG: hypothetical protein P1U39_01525 [Legionellaceae bacterium]|nr:hypothetical protein [Legionellaceae bacterium]